jgi:hypothetical protein
MAIVLILLSLLLACALVVGLELARLVSSSSRADLPQLKELADISLMWI